MSKKLSIRIFSVLFIFILSFSGFSQAKGYDDKPCTCGGVSFVNKGQLASVIVAEVQSISPNPTEYPNWTPPVDLFGPPKKKPQPPPEPEPEPEPDPCCPEKYLEENQKLHPPTFPPKTPKLPPNEPQTPPEDYGPPYTPPQGPPYEPPQGPPYTPPTDPPVTGTPPTPPPIPETKTPPKIPPIQVPPFTPPFTPPKLPPLPPPPKIPQIPKTTPPKTEPKGDQSKKGKGASSRSRNTGANNNGNGNGGGGNGGGGNGGGGAGAGGGTGTGGIPASVLSALSKYSAKSGGPSARAIAVAMSAYQLHKGDISNHNAMLITDFDKSSSEVRTIVINPETGEVYARTKSAHGKGSDPSNTGSVQKTSDVDKEKTSELGSFVLSNYYGSHGDVLLYNGLDAGNKNAASRYIELHGAGYVTNADNSKCGRSDGCTAVPQGLQAPLRAILSGGFAYNYRSK